MSETLAIGRLRPRRGPAATPARSRTRRQAPERVAAGTRVGTAPFALLVVMVLGGGLLVLLLLNTLAAQDAFRLSALERSTAALADEQQQLATTVQQASAPAALAARAARLGLVPAAPEGFVRLRDGRIVGLLVGTPPLAAGPVSAPAPRPAARAIRPRVKARTPLTRTRAAAPARTTTRTTRTPVHH